MKLSFLLTLAALALGILATSAQGDGDTGKSDPSPSFVGKNDVISVPTYAQSMDDAIREMIEDFNHMATSLTEGFAQHPIFSRHRFGEESKSSSSKPFSTWGHFGSLTRWSPRYEVIDDAKNFRVKMDVPGFHFHEMKVELESGGQVLSILGTKESSVLDASNGWEDKEKKAAMGEKAADKENMEEEKFAHTTHSTTSFQQKFTLDPSIDTHQMTANLVNGVLEVTAPRKHGAWNKKHIPITQFDEDTWEELLATEVDPGHNAVLSES